MLGFLLCGSYEFTLALQSSIAVRLGDDKISLNLINAPRLFVL